MSTPPFRADHVGSLLRPPALRAAQARAKAGELDATQLADIENEAIRELIALQEEVGLKAITDGEARRDAWHLDYIYRIGGIERSADKLHVHFESPNGAIDFEGAALKVRERLSLPSTIFEEAFLFLRDNVPRGVPKLTVPSPSMVHYRGGRAAIDEAAYPGLDEFYDDLAKVYAQEIRNLGALGCTYLQLDDTSLAYLNDPRQRALIASQGGDPENQHEIYIDIINRAVAAKPDAMTITTHLCRG
ncbi:MAG TPA: 5-methyltetrahydropteroyltriglutamate--homocysteine S-methyltransferase, partial [Sphingomonadaceae bacterium]|nr:5-methyltetrahydropteroyltriglutamate--homocysteine S-methyltransferase [Sphingomonadaceae bacterium]